MIRPQKLSKEQILEVLKKEYHRIISYFSKYSIGLEKTEEEILNDMYTALIHNEKMDAYDTTIMLDALGWSVNFKLSMILDDIIYKINTLSKKLQAEWVKLNKPEQKMKELDTVVLNIQGKEYVGNILHVNKHLAQYVVNIPEIHSTHLDTIIIDWEDPTISRLEKV